MQQVIPDVYENLLYASQHSFHLYTKNMTIAEWLLSDAFDTFAMRGFYQRNEDEKKAAKIAKKEAELVRLKKS